MKYFLFLVIIFIFSNSYSDIIKPNPIYEPEEVVSIQLNALKNNNDPYDNAGIEQTWEFAHPMNRVYTGPLSKFKKMIYSASYVIMLNHNYHNILLIEKNENRAFFIIEIEDKVNNKFAFQWILEKVYIEGEFQDCWMTTSVSPPKPLAKSA